LRSPRGKAIRPAVAYLAAIGLAAGLTACSGSGEPNQFPTERAGEYEVEVTSATFPLRQKVAETY
jgi:hypothetical protein